MDNNLEAPKLELLNPDWYYNSEILKLFRTYYRRNYPNSPFAAHMSPYIIGTEEGEVSPDLVRTYATPLPTTGTLIFNSPEAISTVLTEFWNNHTTFDPFVSIFSNLQQGNRDSMDIRLCLCLYGNHYSTLTVRFARDPNGDRPCAEILYTQSLEGYGNLDRAAINTTEEVLRSNGFTILPTQTVFVDQQNGRDCGPISATVLHTIDPDQSLAEQAADVQRAMEHFVQNNVAIRAEHRVVLEDRGLPIIPAPVQQLPQEQLPIPAALNLPNTHLQITVPLLLAEMRTALEAENKDVGYITPVAARKLSFVLELQDMYEERQKGFGYSLHRSELPQLTDNEARILNTLNALEDATRKVENQSAEGKRRILSDLSEMVEEEPFSTIAKLPIQPEQPAVQLALAAQPAQKKQNFIFPATQPQQNAYRPITVPSILTDLQTTLEAENRNAGNVTPTAAKKLGLVYGLQQMHQERNQGFKGYPVYNGTLVMTPAANQLLSILVELDGLVNEVNNQSLDGKVRVLQALREMIGKVVQKDTAPAPKAAPYIAASSKILKPAPIAVTKPQPAQPAALRKSPAALSQPLAIQPQRNNYSEISVTSILNTMREELELQNRKIGYVTPTASKKLSFVFGLQNMYEEQKQGFRERPRTSGLLHLRDNEAKILSTLITLEDAVNDAGNKSPEGKLRVLGDLRKMVNGFAQKKPSPASRNAGYVAANSRIPAPGYSR